MEWSLFVSRDEFNNMKGMLSMQNTIVPIPSLESLMEVEETPSKGTDKMKCSVNAREIIRPNTSPIIEETDSMVISSYVVLDDTMKNIIMSIPLSSKSI